MAKPERPLLLLPIKPIQKRTKGKPKFPPKPIAPSRTRQRKRLGQNFANVLRSLRDLKRGIDVMKDPYKIVPGRALVFEIAGSITKFYEKAKQIPEIEFLFDEQKKFTPDEDFYFDEAAGKKIDGTLYVLMPSEASLKRLVRLFQMRTKGDPLDDYKAYRDLFDQLKTIRVWGPQDRLPEDTRENWRYLLEENPDQPVRFEAELIYREATEDRRIAENNLKQNVIDSGGKIIGNVVMLDEIRYHSALVEVPASSIYSLLENDRIGLAASNDVFMLRPEPSVMFPIDNQYKDDEFVENLETDLLAEELEPPIAAILDGVPMQKHQLLEKHIIVEDPMGLEELVTVEARHHGTGMASLVIHGDLHEKAEPIKRSIVCHPLMQAEQDFQGIWYETLPKDRLPIDVIYEAIQRIKSGYGENAPTYPGIIIFNHSLGDYSRPYIHNISPWAKLLDWLSYKHRILFIVSSGNIKEPIYLEKYDSLIAFEDDDPSIREAEIMKALVRERNKRTILSPAEAINVLTVGAAHEDNYDNPPETKTAIDPYVSANKPNISSALGHGYLKSIKPEFLAPGGRELTNIKFHDNKCFLYPSTNSGAFTGQRIARPSQDQNGAWNRCGSSNSAALTTRAAIQLYEVLKDIGDGNIHNVVSPGYEAVLLKALLVHGAKWNDQENDLEAFLKEEHDLHWKTARTEVPRFSGYGKANFSRVKNCTAQRATTFSIGELSKDQEAIVELPLPPSLESIKELRRFWVTLAWLSPVNSKYSGYKRARLSYSPVDAQNISDVVGVQRNNILQPNDFHTRKGTVIHEGYSGEQATPFIHDRKIRLRIVCPEPNDQNLDQPIPFSVVTSIEVGEDSKIPVYEEVRTGIRELFKERVQNIRE